MKVKCGCTHEFQDEKYGKGVRIATPCKSVNGVPSRLRCTVCGTEHSHQAEKKGK